jgi:soluble lytic murein transglycosylase-like protein
VPVSTALAIVHQESGFRPHVTGGAGEIGLMQLKCQTARGMGFSGSCKALYDPDTNLRFGMKYLKAALKRGSVGYYNAGIHAKSLPKAARKYATSVASKTANDG